MTITNPTLIPWDEVLEGPVWYRQRKPDGMWWDIGHKLGCCFYRVGLATRHMLGKEDQFYEFAAAEQQPGQHAAEIADNRRLREGLTTWLDMLRNSPDTAVVTRAHVEDRLAALLSHGCLRYEA